MSSLRLDWCSHEAAKYAVEHWHYSLSLPTPPYVRIGVWESESFIGCILFSRGAAQHIGKPYGLDHVEVAELTRVAMTTHGAPVSRVVAIALKFLVRRCPGLRLLVSYADPAHGHHGGIYQALGWVFVGQGPQTVEYIGPDGKRWHGRMVSPTGFKKVYGRYRKVLRPSECRTVECVGKYKYLYPLDAAMRAQIEPLRKPYPKRASEASSDAPPVQGGEDGAAPILTLQSNTDASG